MRHGTFVNVTDMEEKKLLNVVVFFCIILVA